ncbi:MAG: DUF493 family protein [Ekhidna sp.]|nr:DUF493 family protein [Ekhidna sp.]MBC6409756.1 DUF493 family protein [Ekhidna sp.]MBC6425267.1 DUF493 family protein [Ekhidna sp.]
MSWDEQAFREKLENNHDFPGEYIFRFIIKPEHQSKVESLLEGAEVKFKSSSGNKYLSVTMNRKMQSSQEVIKIYKEAYKIEGIISL